jgi:hypothetical protein
MKSWKTYQVVCYQYDIGGDPRSQGGVHLLQVRRKGVQWQTRIVQSNAGVTAASKPATVTDNEGRRLAEKVKGMENEP